MQASPVRIIEYFDGRKQSLIPLFQRPYTWEKDKWSVLWEDIMAYYDGGGTASHFMGAVVSIPVKTVPVGVNKHLVIDGQQRLTTLAIVLAVLRDEGASNRIDDYLLNRNDDGPDKLKLLPTHGDRDVYKALVVDRLVPTTPSRITAAYDYFRQRVREERDSAQIDPNRLLETIEQCLQVVMINLGDTDDPYLIFESLNAKGEPLTQADLVRNYVLMKFRHSLEAGGEQARIYEAYWKPVQDSLGSGLTSFLRHYCMKEGVAVKEGTVYSAVKNRLAGLTDHAALEAELKEMRLLGDFYARFVDPSKEASAALRARLVAFNELDVTTCYPLLLRLFASHTKQAISDDDLEMCLHLIESFVVRRAVCAVPTNTLRKLFIQWSKDYREKEVVRWLGLRMAAGSGNSRWPNDSQFKADFQTKEQYGRKATKHVLASLEASFDHKEPADLTNATIEHLMPQELTPDWKVTLGAEWEDTFDRFLHTFGNLTLTGYNSELGNLPFPRKQEQLINSHIELNRWICQQSGWNASAIEARAATLAEMATKIWLGPESFS